MKLNTSVASALLICLTGAALQSKAQMQPQGVVKTLTEYTAQTLQEKIFVHTDRSAYLAGEIIWFKVYCADAANNHLSSLSKVAYVEVIDKDQIPVLQAKIALQEGTGSGSFVVPLQLRSGNFTLRAYTNWMKNFDPEYYFHQNLSIYNTIKYDNIPVAAQKAIPAYDIQFFPEGGNLVDELQSKVAFRITDNAGKGIDCNGALLNQSNDTVLRFRPARFGIGNFTFTPRRGQHYHAVITTTAGISLSQSLPQALNAGFVLTVTDATRPGGLDINVRTNTNNGSAFLVMHNQQKVMASHTLQFQNGSAAYRMDNNSLSDGVTFVTLFDQSNRPVCERLYFKKPEDQLVVQLTADTREYALRKKVSLSISSGDGLTKPEAADLSMAVFVVDSLPLKHADISSYLWMSSELKGIVESPEYYLKSDEPGVKEGIDNLMLTHGWRRFKWEDILENKKPSFKFLPEYEGHVVSGKVVNRSNESPGAEVLGFLSVPGSLFQLYTAKSAEDGSIYFNTTNFFGSRLVVGQAGNGELNTHRLDFISPFSERFSSLTTPVFNMSPTLSAGLLKRSINMQVQNVYTGEKLNLLHVVEGDTANFYGKPEVKYMLDDYTRFSTMEEVLREYVREVNVKKRKGNFILTTLIKNENGIPDVTEPVVLLDGVPQFDSGNKIAHYDPLKVKQLEVVKGKYFLGTSSFDGIVSFITYNGDLDGFRLDTTSTVVDYDALQLKREFYSPVYETTEQYKSRLPDFRSLLYWSPNIKTGIDGKKEISFYTSDRPGRYAVVVQGMTKHGKAGSKVLMIDVKEGN